MIISNISVELKVVADVYIALKASAWSVKGTKFINLTPHVLDLHLRSGEVVQIENATLVCDNKERVFATTANLPRIDVEETEVTEDDSIRTFVSKLGAPKNVPMPQSGCMYVVSALFAQAMREQGRTDFVTVHPVRKDGKIVGCDGFCLS